jgi:HEAT repeat protein
VFVVLAAVAWSWLHLWDHYHPAAPAGRRLWSGAPEERVAAVADLARFGRDDTDVAIPALLECLTDRDARVRAAAAMAFVSVVPGTRGEEPRTEHISESAAALFKSMNDPQPVVRSSATEAIWMVMSVVQVPASEPLLNEVRTALVERLGDADASVRLAAIRGLGTIAPKLGNQPPAGLVAALEDESEKTRAAAALALASFPRGLSALLPTLVRSLDNGREQSIAVLLHNLERVRPPRFSRDSFRGLVAALASRDSRVIRMATADLVTFKSAAGTVVPDLATTLAQLIDSRPKEIAARDQATTDLIVAITETVEVLAPHASSQDSAVAALEKILRLEIDRRCRIAAAKALGQFRPTPNLFAALTGRIDDHDSKVRVTAMWAIDHADFGTEYHVPQKLAGALEDGSAEIRGAAAAAIGHSGTELDPMIPALLRHAQHDSDSEVRSICCSVLEICSKPPKVTPAIIPDLIKALECPDESLREALCTLLSRFGRRAEPAVPALLRVLKDTRTETASRYAWIAAGAIGDIAPGTSYADLAVADLIESLGYPDMRGPTSSIAALAAFGPKAASAIPQLRRLELSGNDGLKEAATKALARIREAR